MLDRAQLVIGRTVGDIAHPAVIDQRRRGNVGARRARVLVGVRFLEDSPDLLQEGAAVRVILERLHSLPGDIHSRIPSDDIADEPPALLPRRKYFRKITRTARQNQVRNQALLVEVTTPAVELLG